MLALQNQEHVETEAKIRLLPLARGCKGMRVGEEVEDAEEWWRLYRAGVVGADMVVRAGARVGRGWRFGGMMQRVELGGVVRGLLGSAAGVKPEGRDEVGRLGQGEGGKRGAGSGWQTGPGWVWAGLGVGFGFGSWFWVMGMQVEFGLGLMG